MRLRLEMTLVSGLITVATVASESQRGVCTHHQAFPRISHLWWSRALWLFVLIASNKTEHDRLNVPVETMRRALFPFQRQ